MTRSQVNALYLWNESYTNLSDIDIYFDEIVHKTENDFNTPNDILSFIANECIDCVVIQNPFLNEKKQAIYEILKQNKITCFISDRGALPNSWFFDPNGFNADSSSYDPVHWDQPLTEERKERVEEYIKTQTQTDIALEKQGDMIGADNLRQKLGIDVDKKILFVPLQRPSDTVIKYFSGHVKDMDDFLNQIVHAQKMLADDWVFIVKKHPLEVERPFSEQLYYVDDNTHFKDLLQLCDAVALINSGVGVTAMMYQKPVYYFGDAFYGHAGLNQSVASAVELSDYLKSNAFAVDTQKMQRFISYLTEDFYSFGTFHTELVAYKDAYMTATRSIDFSVIRNLPNCHKNNTLIVTDIDFWKKDLGSRMRLYQMFQSLRKEINIKILYISPLSKSDIELIETLPSKHLIDYLDGFEIRGESHPALYQGNYDFLQDFYNADTQAKYQNYIKRKTFHCVVFEYIKLHYLAEVTPSHICKIIDTHDLMSRRYQNCIESGNDIGVSIKIESFEEEINVLKKYDYVLSIQEEEQQTVSKRIEAEKVILVKHSIKTQKTTPKSSDDFRILFISGTGNFNNIKYFIDNVWGYIERLGHIKLVLAGSICNMFRPEPTIKLLGRVDDVLEAYEQADVAINPTLYGSGLKIKNVEALAYGIPLITTDIGMQGMEDGANSAFLLANTIDEWIDAILMYKMSPTLRTEFSRRGMEYCEKHFSENVYAPLINIIKKAV